MLGRIHCFECLSGHADALPFMLPWWTSHQHEPTTDDWSALAWAELCTHAQQVLKGLVFVLQVDKFTRGRQRTCDQVGQSEAVL